MYEITAERCIVRDTASRKGRTRSVSPEASAARFLHYGRIGNVQPEYAAGGSGIEAGRKK